MIKITRLSRKNLTTLLLLVLLLVSSIAVYVINSYKADTNQEEEPPYDVDFDSSVFFGKTVDEKGNPIANVDIILGDFMTTTGDDGSFFLSPVMIGSYSLSFIKNNKPLYRKDEFGSISIAGGASTAQTFTLIDSPPITRISKVEITKPAKDSYISNTTDVGVNVDGDVRVVSLKLYVNGILRYDINSEPFNIPWDTKTTSEGKNTLKAVATDVDGNSVESSEVSINVDNTFPTASITKPANGALLYGSTTIEVDAKDNISLDKVELYRDDKLIETKTSSPYSFSFDTTKDGNGLHSIFARAYDKAKNEARSSNTVSVNIDNAPPSISLDSPGNNDTIKAGDITLSATSSSVSGIAKVDFYYSTDTDKDKLIATNNTASSSPYTTTWKAKKGSYTLYAKATSNNGKTRTTDPINVTITDTDVLSVGISSPPNNTPFKFGTEISIEASTQSTNPIDRVEFYVDNTKINTDKTSPYSTKWTIKSSNKTCTTNCPDQSYTLQATLYDNTGKSTQSAKITIKGTANLFQLQTPKSTLGKVIQKIKSLVGGAGK